MSEDLARIHHAIVDDDGTRALRQECCRFGGDECLRLTRSEVEALEEWDRVVTQTDCGTKIIVEMIPETPRAAPIEVRKRE